MCFRWFPSAPRELQLGCSHNLFCPGQSFPVHPSPHLVPRAGASPCHRGGQQHSPQLQAPAIPRTDGNNSVWAKPGVVCNFVTPKRNFTEEKEKSFPGTLRLPARIPPCSGAPCALHIVKLCSHSLLLCSPFPYFTHGCFLQLLV